MSLDGVRIDELHCPTCGAWMVNEVHRDREEFYAEQVLSPILDQPPLYSRPYLKCMNGHKWTIKTLTRVRNHPDYVLLGDYVGHE
jgi:hypothetical protein